MARGGRVIYYPSKHLKQLRAVFQKLYPKVQIEPSTWYRTEYEFHFPIYTKKKTVARKDVTNMVKYLEDCIFKELLDTNGEHIDDSRVKSSHASKFEAEIEKVVVRIFPTD